MLTTLMTTRMTMTKIADTTMTMTMMTMTMTTPRTMTRTTMTMARITMITMTTFTRRMRRRRTTTTMTTMTTTTTMMTKARAQFVGWPWSALPGSGLEPPLRHVSGGILVINSECHAEDPGSITLSGDNRVSGQHGTHHQ